MNTAQTAPQTNNDNDSKGDGLQVVIGLGQSGLATVNYLVKHCYTVAVTDMNEQSAPCQSIYRQREHSSVWRHRQRTTQAGQSHHHQPGVPSTTLPLRQPNSRAFLW